FRLLRFLPGDTLDCELVHVLMGSAPIYYALSYAWGSAEAYENILWPENGLAVRMPCNPVTLCRNLRIGAHIREQEAYIWADAICINQHDLSERGAQVLLMTQIYSDATMVAIWLGEHADDSILAVEKLIEIATHLVELITWQAIFKLLDRPWFTRAWIVQE
ncbi:heterokaryon incompatibility, partial [Hyaloscypha bicolor E]